jgi:hypothetical protein
VRTRSLTEGAVDDALAPFVRTIAGFEQEGARGDQEEKSDPARATRSAQLLRPSTAQPAGRADEQGATRAGGRARQQIIPKASSGWSEEVRPRGVGSGPLGVSVSPTVPHSFSNLSLQVPHERWLSTRLHAHLGLPVALPPHASRDRQLQHGGAGEEARLKGSLSLAHLRAWALLTLAWARLSPRKPCPICSIKLRHSLARNAFLN